MTSHGSDLPDFSTMTPEERQQWLAKRPRGGMPAGAGPILVAVVCSLAWFLLLSPALLAGVGERLLPTPVEKGTARIESCQSSWRTLGQTWQCEAPVRWDNGSSSTEKVMSRTEIAAGETPVERRRIRHGRDTSADHLTGSTRVVTATFPSNSLAGVGTVVAVNTVAMVAVWAVCGRWAVRQVRRRR